MKDERLQFCYTCKHWQPEPEHGTRFQPDAKPSEFGLCSCWPSNPESPFSVVTLERGRWFETAHIAGDIDSIQGRINTRREHYCSAWVHFQETP